LIGGAGKIHGEKSLTRKDATAFARLSTRDVGKSSEHQSR
jgi:hypothetical protein